MVFSLFMQSLRIARLYDRIWVLSASYLIGIYILAFITVLGIDDQDVQSIFFDIVGEL